MPLAVTHILVPIITLELFREVYPQLRKYFENRHVFLIGIAGILPDADTLIFRAIGTMGSTALYSGIGHRIIFHNVWIPMGFFAFFLVFRHLSSCTRGAKRKRYSSFSKVFLVLFFGFAAHLLLDAMLTGYVMPFYPLSEYMIEWNILGKIEVATGMPQLSMLVSMDALLLMFWLWHQEMERHISDYF